MKNVFSYQYLDKKHKQGLWPTGVDVVTNKFSHCSTSVFLRAPAHFQSPQFNRLFPVNGTPSLENVTSEFVEKRHPDNHF